MKKETKLQELERRIKHLEELHPIPRKTPWAEKCFLCDEYGKQGPAHYCMPRLVYW